MASFFFFFWPTLIIILFPNFYIYHQNRQKHAHNCNSNLIFSLSIKLLHLNSINIQFISHVLIKIYIVLLLYYPIGIDYCIIFYIYYSIYFDGLKLCRHMQYNFFLLSIDQIKPKDRLVLYRNRYIANLIRKRTRVECTIYRNVFYL
ncbi:hypothetical protein V1478_008097 [Vespula squamosa]|uniref:Transmembrane protein n=1 Tax=Vespula squamosa TaxID=30214 RepID=A0ABD2AXT2_VESSQ